MNLSDIGYSKRELIDYLTRRRTERSLLEYVKYKFKMQKKVFLVSEHHIILCMAMEDVFFGKIKNLVVNIAPRYSKTEIIVKSFVEWSHARIRDCKFIHLTYSDRLALDNSAEIRENIKSDWYQNHWPCEFLKSADAKNKWKTKDGFEMSAGGTAGPVTGFGAGRIDVNDPSVPADEIKQAENNLIEMLKRSGLTIDDFANGHVFGGAIIIDDPLKPADAESDDVRTKINKRLNNTIMSRRNSPRYTPVIIVMQRLHEDDMTGYVIEGEAGEEFEQIKLRAIKEDGTPLWPAKHSIEQLESMRKADPYMYSGQYDQEPSPADGEFFQKGWFDIVPVAPAGALTCRGWDFAGSVKTSSAYSAGIKVSLFNGTFYIEDSNRFKGLPGEVEREFLNTSHRDGKSVHISIPQDPGQAGKFQVSHFVQQLLGYSIEATPETGSKEQRARPASSQAQAGNVKLVKGDWNKEFLDELAKFPNGKFKDQVDGMTRAMARLTELKKGKMTIKKLKGR